MTGKTSIPILHIPATDASPGGRRAEGFEPIGDVAKRLVAEAQAARAKREGEK